MRHRTTTALLTATLSGIAAAALLVILPAAPRAESAESLDPAAVASAVNSAVRSMFPSAVPADPPPSAADGFGAFDPATATWHLRTRGGDPTVFTFGLVGSIPLVGDWDGDSADTPGTYDPATGLVSLRNSNTTGESDVTYVLGIEGDLPIVGDFDGDGTDAVSVYRPGEETVYRYDMIGSDGANLGDAVDSFAAGGPGLLPLAGDWDGDGTESVGFHDPATGVVTYRNTMDAGDPDGSFAFEASGDVFVLGDWTGDGIDTPGTLDSDTGVQLRYSNTTGGPDETYPWGDGSWIPVAGSFGALDSPVTVALDGAPDGLAWAIESLYLEHGHAPYAQSALGLNTPTSSVPAALGVIGQAFTAEAFDAQVAVVQTDTDRILAVSEDGWNWEVVGGSLPSQGFEQLGPNDPRFVVLIGSDADDPANGDPFYSHADSIHLYTFDPTSNEGAIVGIPRDTAMPYTGTPNVDGMQKINRTMLENGPQVPVQVIADESGLPLEGYIQTGFGTAYTGFPGFMDVVDEMSGLNFTTLYSVPSQCLAGPPTPHAAVWSTPQTGAGALAFARERKCVPTDDLGQSIRNGNAVRTLGQGLQLKAAIAQVQALGPAAMPGLLDIMDDYVNTDLSLADLLTLADTIYDVDPGTMPTIDPDDVTNYGAEAFHLNQGTLPNVLVEGCTGIFDNSGSTPDYAFFQVTGNYETYADLADGKLDRVPIYEYNSGYPGKPIHCPTLLPPTNRLFGTSRNDTAVQISKSLFRQGVPVVYIATDANFPDALAGGPVAAINRGPILLVRTTMIAATVSDELTRLKPNRIVVLGGPLAVNDSVMSQLNAYTDGSVTRLFGQSRYDTAAAISASTFTAGVDTAYIATASTFPDALVGGPVAALNRSPILLVSPTSVPTATADELTNLEPKRIVVLGGPLAVSDAVLAELGDYTDGTVTRLFGQSRYDTAAAISESRFSRGVAVAYVATGIAFPDALSGGPVAGMNSDPILLVSPTSIPTATADELTRLEPKRIVVLGGSLAVSDAVLAELADYTVP